MTSRVIAIDWSGALKGARKKIWLAEANNGNLVTLENGRDRGEIADHLIELARRSPKLIVGLDFAFSLPSWFLAQHELASVHDLWSLAEREAEAWLSRCQPPFWGRPGTKRPKIPNELLFRRTDREVPAPGGITPKSVFQIAGPGSVGTGSLRGMPILRRLHSAGFSIWPFDPPGWPKVVEIWPRILTGVVTKSSPVERAEYLRDRYPTLSSKHYSDAAGSDDAFDAAVSALTMADHVDELTALPVALDQELLFEGEIWHPKKPSVP